MHLSPLRQIRKTAHISIDTLAERSNVPVTTIRSLETGKNAVRNMSLGIAIKLADALGCEPDDFLLPGDIDELSKAVPYEL